MDWLVHLDERLFRAVNGWGTPGLDPVFLAITWLGHGVPLALLILGGMFWRDRPGFRRHALAMVLSVSVGALAVEAIKWSVQRDRPPAHFAGEEAVRLPGEALRERSFPSGHSQAAFGAATYVALVYPALAVPALGLAALVAFSRVYLGVHFPLDALLGSLLGVAFSVAGFRLRAGWERRRPSARSRAG